VHLFVGRVRQASRARFSMRMASVLARRRSRHPNRFPRVVPGFVPGVERLRSSILVEPASKPSPSPSFDRNDELAHHYAAHFTAGTVEVPAAGILVCRDLRISFPTGVHLLGGVTVDEAMLSPSVVDNPKYAYALIRLALARRTTRIDRAVVLSMPWYHNFYHWIVEMLPRVLLLRDPGQYMHHPLLVPSDGPSFIRQSLELTGLIRRAEFVPSGAYSIGEAVIPSRLSRGTNVSPHSIDWLNAAFADVAPGDARRLYVSRRDARIRFVRNETETARWAEEHGFTVFCPSDHTLEQQISAFKGAEEIVGPHGAGLSLLAVAKPGAKVLEIFQEGHFLSSYADIAAIRRQEYGFIVARRDGLGMRVDLGALSAVAQAIGLGS
jgi:capsular polysaccharide biosynthesis protein